MPTLSIATVLLSATLSIVTGYVGSLLNTSRQASRDRRIYGLAILAEVKAIQRGLAHYQDRLASIVGGCSTETERALRQELRLWRHDLSVYINNSGRIGLFSVRTAIEVIEFYHRIRWLDTRITDLLATTPGDLAVFQHWIADHQADIRHARLHSRYLSRLLRREVPATWSEVFRAARRRTLRRRGRRIVPRPADLRPLRVGVRS